MILNKEIKYSFDDYVKRKCYNDQFNVAEDHIREKCIQYEFQGTSRARNISHRIILSKNEDLIFIFFLILHSLINCCFPSLIHSNNKDADSSFWS